MELPALDSCFYLPHHGVLRPERVTTKLRVVSNGSSSTSSGISLNGIMYSGANLLLYIKDVLLWVRRHHYKFATDVTKMYRQIMVHEDDWDLQHILWVDEQLNITSYQLTTVTYSTKAAPYLAVRVLQQRVEYEGDKYPLAVPPLTHGRYVDDIFGGADTSSQLTEIADQLIMLCMAGGFPLAKWQTNHPASLRAISINESSSSIAFEDCETKILGLKWQPHSDHFKFTSRPHREGSRITKRLIASEVAQIFDSLGYLSPVIIRAKMLLEELWLHKLSWDEKLPSRISQRWLNFREDDTQMACLNIPRWIGTFSNPSCDSHGLSDASQLAMAAVIYIKVHSPSTESSITLICAKTKVAPLKRLTVPQLDLSAALLLAKLCHYVQVTLQVSVQSTYLWTDSSVTLTWINTHASRWNDFVRNKVSTIQELTSNAQWRFVPGKDNPADCASRGITTSQLAQHSLFWRGPLWLSKSNNHWPTQTPSPDDSTSLEERPGVSLVMTTTHSNNQWNLINRYSTRNKLIRITAIIFRAKSRIMRIPGSSLATQMSPIDLDNSLNYWIKSTQAAFFNSEIKMLADNTQLPQNHALS